MCPSCIGMLSTFLQETAVCPETTYCLPFPTLWFHSTDLSFTMNRAVLQRICNVGDMICPPRYWEIEMSSKLSARHSCFWNQDWSPLRHIPEFCTLSTFPGWDQWVRRPDLTYFHTHADISNCMWYLSEKNHFWTNICNSLKLMFGKSSSDFYLTFSVPPYTDWLLCGSAVKYLPAIQEAQEMWVWSLGQEDPLEKEMATHSSILAWRIPCTEETGGLWSRGCRVGHYWSSLAVVA